MCELLLPAQHDTGDISRASLWQKDSNTLASECVVVVFAGGFPWLAVLALWDNPPELLWCSGGVSLPPSSLSACTSTHATAPPLWHSSFVSVGLMRQLGSVCVLVPSRVFAGTEDGGISLCDAFHARYIL